MNEMKVSVIIPTYNGANKILNVLRAIEQQVRQPDEVIVVIDGSTDNTLQIIKQNSFSFRSFKLINQENGGRAKVRNNGAAAAVGELLIFFDDDMRPDPSCVAVHYEHHINYPGSILTGALLEEVTPNTSDFLKFKAYLSNKWSSGFKSGSQKPLQEEALFLSAANFSIAKELFQELGGFDDELNDAEDFDLAVRAFKAGVPLYVNLNAHAWHDEKVTCSSYIKRLRQYAIAQDKLSRLKPALYYKKNKFQSAAPVGLKKAGFLLFANGIWIILVDETNVLKLLPQRLRYKLYDVIVTANGVFFPDKVKL
jgi:GT2 family glycosyltransferase